MAASQAERNVFEKDSVVRGHHIYKVYWMPVIEVELTLMTEDDNEHDEHDNEHDEHAVTVVCYVRINFVGGASNWRPGVNSRPGLY